MILGGKLSDRDYSARSDDMSGTTATQEILNSSVNINFADLATAAINFDDEKALFPSTTPARERTLVDVISTTMDVYPSALAIDDGSHKLTYEQLREEVDELAKRLWAMDVGAGDRVGVRVPSGSKIFTSPSSVHFSPAPPMFR